MAEEWLEWTDRFSKSENSRIVGPVLMAFSLVTIMSTTIYCLLKNRTKRRAEMRDEEDSFEDKFDISYKQCDTKNLLSPVSDIACFPDGSPRLVVRLLKPNITLSTFYYLRFPSKYSHLEESESDVERHEYEGEG